MTVLGFAWLGRRLLDVVKGEVSATRDMDVDIDGGRKRDDYRSFRAKYTASIWNHLAIIHVFELSTEA